MGEYIEKAEKQLVGIKIINILSIILYSMVWIYGIYNAFTVAEYSDGNEGSMVFLAYTITFGVFLLLAIYGLNSINKRLSYAVPVNRATLILFSFWTGIIPIGVILLVIFWPRLNQNFLLRWMD